MIKNRMTIDKTATGYVMTVDGGSIECETDAELMSRVGAEIGMPFNRAQRQLFERMEAAEANLKKTEQQLYDNLEIMSEYEAENEMLKAAIVALFLRAYKEG